MATAKKIRSTPGQFLPLSIVRMVWNRKWMICLLTVLLSTGAALWIRRLPNVYRADAVIVVDSQKIPEKFVASTVQVTLNDSLSAISQHALSSNKLQAIIDDYGLYRELWAKKSREEIIATFRKELQITVERGFGGGRSGAFRIAYEGPSAAQVVAVVERAAELFVRENLKSREERALGTSEFLETQLKQAKKSLEEQEANLSKFKLLWTGELPQQESALLATLNRLQTELEGNQDALTRGQQNKVLLESTLRFAESSLAGAMRSAEASVAQAARPESTSAAIPAVTVRSSEGARARLEALRARYFDEHPEVRRAKVDLQLALEQEKRDEAAKPPAAKAVEAAVTRVPVNANPQLVAEINRERERISSTKVQLDLLNRDMERRTAERERILAEISSYQARVEKLPVREQQMAALTRDYETTRANYHSLLDKKMSAEMASEMERQQQSERFTIADPPRKPGSPIKPKRMLMYLGAGVFSLIFSTVLALGLELLQNRFLGEWELPPNVAVLGRIAVIDARGGWASDERSITSRRSA
ncbi:MAG TPA: GNVR domain-containing protein [Bryobacteraceae bacterium]|nr:GNVR domain-containing protein [Bryobacteraceae bacterium]